MYEKVVCCSNFYLCDAGQYLPYPLCMFGDMSCMYVSERRGGGDERDSVLQDHPPHSDGKLLV